MRPVVRRRGAESHSVTNLEPFFDLVFAFAVSYVGLQWAALHRRSGGAEIVIAQPSSALRTDELVAVLAGPILCLLGHIGFRLRMIGTVSKLRVTATGVLGLA